MRKYILPAAVAIFTILRLPSLIEPVWYSDENVYLVISRALSAGSILYRDIWDNKPPVLYILYFVTHGDLFLIKLLSLVFGIAAVIGFYLLTTHIFSLKRGGIITLLFGILFGLPLLEGNIANAENFMLAPIALAFYFTLAEKKRWFVAGLLFSLVLMTKVVAVFDLTALMVILFLQSTFSSSLSVGRFVSFICQKKLLKFYLGVLILPIAFSVYFVMNHAFLSFVHGVVSTNIGYVRYENDLFLPFGRLLLKTVGLIFGLLLIILNRKRLHAQEKIIYPWLLFGMYSVYFSDRAYTHYILMGLMPFLLFVAGLMQRRVKVLSVVISTVIFILVFISFPLYTRTFQYYQNYLTYIFTTRSFVDYAAFFDSSLPQKYETANYLKAKIRTPHDLFYWSDKATLYVLTNTLPPEKYIVAYHILFYNNAIPVTKFALDTLKPRFLISDKNDPAVPDEFTRQYRYTNSIGSVRLYER